MFGDDDTQNDDIFDFLQQYQKTTLAAANGNIVSLYYWQSYKQDSKEPLDFQAQARLTVQEGGIPSIKENGINFMCRGRTLAGDSYLALQQIPEFESENNRQTAFNIILTNLAHLDRAYSPNDGWEEYDNDRLLSPNDYSRSIHLAP